jgi:hypothetical protein
VDLPAPLARLGDRIYDLSVRLGTSVQSAVLTVLLFSLYVLGMGLTRMFAVVFGRRFLSLYDSTPAESYWQPAEGYTVERSQLEKEY